MHVVGHTEWMKTLSTCVSEDMRWSRLTFLTLIFTVNTDDSLSNNMAVGAEENRVFWCVCVCVCVCVSGIIAPCNNIRKPQLSFVPIQHCSFSQRQTGKIFCTAKKQCCCHKYQLKSDMSESPPLTTRNLDLRS